MQYDSFNIYYLEVMTKKKKIKGQGQKVEYQQKGIIKRSTHLALTVQTLLAG